MWEPGKQAHSQVAPGTDTAPEIALSIPISLKADLLGDFFFYILLINLFFMRMSIWPERMPTCVLRTGSTH